MGNLSSTLITFRTLRPHNQTSLPWFRGCSTSLPQPEGETQAQPLDMFILDKRLPKMRVCVMLHGEWDSHRVGVMKVDANMSSTQLGVSECV